MNGFSRFIRGATYWYAPDLHPVRVANHEAERRLCRAAVHLQKLGIPGRVFNRQFTDKMRKRTKLSVVDS